MATSAPGRTVTGPTMAEPVSGRRQPVVGAPAGDQTQMLEDHAALELLANGSLEVEGRVVEASNVTL